MYVCGVCECVYVRACMLEEDVGFSDLLNPVISRISLNHSDLYMNPPWGGGGCFVRSVPESLSLSLAAPGLLWGEVRRGIARVHLSGYDYIICIKAFHGESGLQTT